MKNQVKKNFSHMAQHRMIIEMIDAGFTLAEKLGRHPLAKGCNCIACVNKRKQILKTLKTDWKFNL